MSERFYAFRKNVVCEDSTKCSQKIVLGLEQKTGWKLFARGENDTGLQAGVSILHEQNNHHIVINLYRRNDSRYSTVSREYGFDEMNVFLLEVLTKESSTLNRILNFIRRRTP